VAGLLALSSCRNDLETVYDFEGAGDQPTQVLEGVELHYTERGNLSHRMAAGRMARHAVIDESAASETGRWLVSDGFSLSLYDSTGAVTAVLQAEDGDFWEAHAHLTARNKVVLTNAAGDRLETDLLYWSADSDRIHTSRPVRVITLDGIIEGTGLEADSRFDNYRILEPTGHIFVRKP
jgi:LPS export ABC transporter protein LptC